MEANTLRPRSIEEECRGRLQHIPAQLVPCVPFGEDAFGEAFGAVTAVGLLYDLKDQFSHTYMIWHVKPNRGFDGGSVPVAKSPLSSGKCRSSCRDDLFHR